jgi:mono/diheme cytochrome c family protein
VTSAAKLKKRRIRRFPRSIIAIAFVALLSISAYVFAQSPKDSKAPSPTKAELVKRGQALFYDHCPICHFGRTDRPGSGRYTGPNLKGLLKGALPVKEAAVRKAILVGTPNMPGYEYMFKPGQMDELIAFLKTYN